jgi:hypothetical protein
LQIGRGRFRDIGFRAKEADDPPRSEIDEEGDRDRENETPHNRLACELIGTERIPSANGLRDEDGRADVDGG